MHPGLEQCWELKSAGKGVYDLGAAYHAAIHPTVKKVESLRRQPSVPPVDPEYLQQELDKERESEAARRGNPRLKRFQEMQRSMTGCWPTGSKMVLPPVTRPSGTRPWGLQTQNNHGSAPSANLYGSNYHGGNRPPYIEQSRNDQFGSHQSANHQQQATNYPVAQHRPANHQFGSHRHSNNPSSRTQPGNHQPATLETGRQHQQTNKHQTTRQQGGQQQSNNRPSSSRQPDGLRSLADPSRLGQAAGNGNGQSSAMAAPSNFSPPIHAVPGTPGSQGKRHHKQNNKRNQVRPPSQAGGNHKWSGNGKSSAKGKSREWAGGPQPDSNRSTVGLVKEEDNSGNGWRHMPMLAPTTPASNSRAIAETPRRLEHPNLPIRSRPEQRTPIRPAGPTMGHDELQHITNLMREIRQEQVAMKEAHLQKEMDIVAKLEQLDEKFERQQALLLSREPVMQSIEADLNRARTRDFTYAFEPAVERNDDGRGGSEGVHTYTPRSGRYHEYDGPYSPNCGRESAEESNASSEDEDGSDVDTSESTDSESTDSDDEPAALSTSRKRKASADKANPSPAKRKVKKSRSHVPNPHLHIIAQYEIEKRDRQNAIAQCEVNKRDQQEVIAQYWIQVSERERQQEQQNKIPPRQRPRRETGSKTDPVILDR